MPKPAGNILRYVGLAAALCRVIPTQLQLLGQQILRVRHLILFVAERAPRRVKQRDAKNNADCVGGNARCQICATQGSDRGRHLQKHADAHIGEALPDIRDSRTRRSGDDRNQRGPNGVAKIDMEEKSQRGHDDHAPTETSQCTEQPGETDINNTADVNSIKPI